LLLSKTVRFQCFRNCLGCQHSGFHRCMDAFQPRNILHGGTASYKHSSIDGKPWDRVISTDTYRSCPLLDYLTVPDYSGHKRMSLEFYEFVIWIEPGVFIRKAHQKSDCHFVVFHLIYKATSWSIQAKGVAKRMNIVAF